MYEESSNKYLPGCDGLQSVTFLIHLVDVVSVTEERRITGHKSYITPSDRRVIYSR